MLNIIIYTYKDNEKKKKRNGWETVLSYPFNPTNIYIYKSSKRYLMMIEKCVYYFVYLLLYIDDIFTNKVDYYYYYYL